MMVIMNEVCDEVIFYVVNIFFEVWEIQVSLFGFILKGNMEIYMLSGELNDENFLDMFIWILLKVIWKQVFGFDFIYLFFGYLYMIVVFKK